MSCLPLEVPTTDEINVHQPAKESGHFKEDLRLLSLVEVESGYVFTSNDCWGGNFSLLNGREVEFQTLQCEQMSSGPSPCDIALLNKMNKAPHHSL